METSIIEWGNNTSELCAWEVVVCFANTNIRRHCPNKGLTAVAKIQFDSGGKKHGGR